MSASDDLLKRLSSYGSDPTKAIKDAESAVKTGQQVYNFANEYGDQIVDILKDPEFKVLIGKVQQIVKVRKMQAAGLGATAEPAKPPSTLTKLNKYADAYLWYLNHKILVWSAVGVGVASLVGGGYLLGRYLHKR